MDNSQYINLENGKYRKNVGIIVINKNKKVLFCERKFLKSANESEYKWQFPQGGIDINELPNQTALRELYEETGAIKYKIKPVCVYSVTFLNDLNPEETFGMLYFADVFELEKELHSEIEKIIITETLPDNWTYPLIQPKLIDEAKIRGYFS